MYLKSLEIQGFKSFADKTHLEFKPGITIVVGPNGSGKSNVVDAIRWVLGEQSVKSLRGGKMEDVIFAGSDKRRSLGMAEVSLTIDNASGTFPLEFNEVTVTRRLYRSGESDYLINRVPCRLRDVHELFMDTGVGKEGISIIGQGKVDEILSVKPSERRGIIEEAAGIVKYRHRKKEAVKKLEDTENSIIRIGDILYELSNQKEPLAEQARVAKIYNNLKEECDSLEIGLIIDEIESATNKLQNLKGSFDNEQKQLEETRSKYYQIQAKEEELKLELNKKESMLSQCQESIYSETIKLEKNDGQDKLITERLQDVNKQEKIVSRETINLKSEMKSLENECEEQKIKYKKLHSQYQERTEYLKEYENKISKDALKDQELSDKLEELKSEHFASLQNQTSINNDIKSNKQKTELLKRQEEQIKNKLNQTKNETKAVTIKLNELEFDAKENNNKQKEIENIISLKEKQMEIDEKKYAEIKRINDDLKNEKNNILARKQILEDMEKGGQGYNQGAREILRLKGKSGIKGIIGSVAQILSVPKNYELAVEVVLGNALQQIITEDELVAKKAINWLKDNKKGRVTFLPITTVKGKQPQGNLPQGNGVIGRLSDLVKYNKRYNGIVEFILGRIWLIQDLDTCIKQAKAIDYRYRLVTLDGQIINAGGSMTGGSAKTYSSGILGRKRNIQELAEKVQEIENKLAINQVKENQFEKEIILTQKDISRLKEKMQEIYVKSIENSKAQERWRAEKERFKAELDTIDWQMSELFQEKETIYNSLHQAETDVKEINTTIAILLKDIDETQNGLKKSRSEKIKRSERLTQLHIEVATISEKITSYERELKYHNERLNQLKLHLSDKKEETDILKEKREELIEARKKLEIERIKQDKCLSDLNNQLDILRQSKLLLQDQINEISVDVKKLGNLLRDRDEKIRQYEIYQSRYETAIDASVRRLYEQYSLSSEEAKDRYERISDRKRSQQRIIEIKDDIISLGQVNLSAIEEYKKLVERIEFLNDQVQDMNEAKEKLHDVIKEMDQIMTNKFNNTFHTLNNEFQNMFKHLFGGGRANLVLTEPDKPLDAGVEIIAQPPGKKTQYLSLLSGGEKALTAIALLMAVLKIKPSPFCVLDEIESNLDEANVHRFASVLKDFSDETQFIVISHRKGTMEIGHILYGVTIEENGVSRVVSVRLEETDKEAS